MIIVAKTGRFILMFAAIAVALVSWRFFLLGFEAAFQDRVHDLKLPSIMFYIHVLASPLALLILPFQFSAKIRARRPNLHRWFGRTYCTMVVFGGISGLFVSFTADANAVARVGFAMLAIFWLAATARAYLLARAGLIADHRAWMIRSAALTFAAVTLRLWLPVLMAAGFSFEIAFTIVAWLSWVLNALIAEYYLRRRSSMARSTPALTPG